MDSVVTKTGNIVTPRPNWAASVSEAFEYRTEIYESETGEEERFSHRMMPRISVQYRADMLDEAARQTFEETVRQTDREFTLPFRWRYVRLGSQIALGGSQFTVDESLPWWFGVGSKLVLESSGAQEVVTVSGITGSEPPFTVSIDAPVANGFASGDRAMLAQMARYPQEMEYQSVVRAHRRTAPTFEIMPEDVLEWQTPAPVEPTFKGLEVIRDRHNWVGALKSSSDDRRETVDFGRGVRDVVWARNHAIYTENRVYTAMGKADADALVHLFMRHRGMRVPFWTRSFARSLPQHSHGVAGTTSLWFNGSPVGTAWNDNPVFQYLWAQWPDGSYQINLITGRGESAGDERFIMADPWDRAVGADTEIRWAVLARFGADRLALEWVTDEHCEASLPIRYLHCDWTKEV